MTDLGTTTDVKALRKIFNPDGLHLVDIGCGDGDLARKLAYVGATVIGIEPDPVQAKKNAHAEPVEHLSFYQARATQLPLEESSIDGLIFSLSLHHIPQNEMQESIDEAFRVLKATGFMMINEPLLEGSYNDVIKPFHDETEVRLQAIAAINDFAKPLYSEWKQYFYTTETVYKSFEEFTDYYLNISYSFMNPDIIISDIVRERFEATREGEVYVLRQPMRIDYFTTPA